MLCAMNETTWQQRILDLIDSGLTLTEIARLCGIKIQGLHDIKSGKNAQPKGYVAVRLYQLHSRRRKAA